MSNSAETSTTPIPPQPPTPPVVHPVVPLQTVTQPPTPPVAPTHTPPAPPPQPVSSPVQKPQPVPQSTQVPTTTPPQVRPAIAPPPPPPRPVVTTPVVAPVPVTHPVIQHPFAAASSPTQEVTKITSLLEIYRSYLVVSRPTTTTIQKTGQAFSNVVKYTLRNATNDVLEVVWSFFVTNSDLLFTNSLGLRGGTYLDVQTRFKVSLFFNAFKLALLGRDVGDPKIMNVALVHSRLRSNTLIRFLQQKAKVIAAKATGN